MKKTSQSKKPDNFDLEALKSLSERVTEVSDDLSYNGFLLPTGDAAVQVIRDLQALLKKSRQTINRLKLSLAYADEVFTENCCCDEAYPNEDFYCGPCKRRKTFEKHIAEAKAMIREIRLAE